jgi:hypothetical protein
MKYQTISNYVEEFALWPGGNAWVYAGVMTLLLLLLVFQALTGKAEEPVLQTKLLPHGSGRWSRLLEALPGWFKSAWVFLALIFLLILFGRSPAFLLEEINVDESSYLAGAVTLAQGGLFWKDVDSLSSGPLMYYSGVLPKLLGLNVDYSSFRFVQVIMLTLSWFLVYLSLRLFVNDRLARLLTIPGVVYRGLMSEGAFLAMHSETPPILLTMGAFYLMARLPWAETGKPLTRTAFWMAFLLGLLPYAKVQSAPLGVAFALWGGLFLLWRYRPAQGRFNPVAAARTVGIYILGGVLPTLLLFVYLLTLADFSMFWRSYVLDNLVYREIPQLVGNADSSFPKFLYEIPGLLMNFNQLSHLTGGCVIVLLLSLGLYYARPVEIPARWKYWLGSAAFYLFFSVLIVVLPGRSYEHYLEYLITPAVLLTAFALAHGLYILQQRLPALPRWSLHLTAFMALALLALPGAVQSLRSSAERASVSHPRHWDHDRYFMDAVLRPYYEPGDRAISFLYNPRFYVYSGLRLGEPRPVYNRLILTKTDTTYYVDRFYRAMRENPPQFFVDSSNALWRYPQHRTRLAELERILEQDYVHFLTMGQVSFYVLKERFEKYPQMAEDKERLEDPEVKAAYEALLGNQGVLDQLDPRIHATPPPAAPPSGSR